MKVYNTIKELFYDLNIETPTVSPHFAIYKYNELEKVEDAIFNPHVKRFFSINFHIKNVSPRRIGHTFFDETKRSINFNSPMQTFSIQSENSVGKEGFGIFFSAEFFKPEKHRFNVIQEFSFFKLNAVPFYKLNNVHFRYLNNLLEHIYEEHINQNNYSQEIIHSMLLILLNYVKRITDNNSDTIKLSRPEEVTYQFENLILKKIDLNYTIAQFAKELCLTPGYLSECVQKATGSTAKKALIDYKILKAKSLLKNSSWSIAEIADALGYSETTNFIKFFRKFQGVTPLVYRNS